jgi:hypothetical protein
MVPPATRYLVGRRGGLFPPSRAPDVSVAIPTVVPGNPYVVPAKASSSAFRLQHEVAQMQTTISAAAVPKASTHAKTNPINRLRATLSFSWYQTANRSGGRRTTKLFSV